MCWYQRPTLALYMKQCCGSTAWTLRMTSSMFVNRNPRPLKHSNLGLVNSLSSGRYFELSDFHIICRIGGATMAILLILISIYCSPKGHAGAGGLQYVKIPLPNQKAMIWKFCLNILASGYKKFMHFGIHSSFGKQHKWLLNKERRNSWKQQY